MAGHYFKLEDEIFTLSLAEEGQFVYIMSISEILHFQSVLLEFEGF